MELGHIVELFEKTSVFHFAKCRRLYSAIWFFRWAWNANLIVFLRQSLHTIRRVYVYLLGETCP